MRIHKRFVTSLILIFAMILSLCGCTKNIFMPPSNSHEESAVSQESDDKDASRGQNETTSEASKNVTTEEELSVDTTENHGNEGTDGNSVNDATTGSDEKVTQGTKPVVNPDKDKTTESATTQPKVTDAATQPQTTVKPTAQQTTASQQTTAAQQTTTAQQTTAWGAVTNLYPEIKRSYSNVTEKDIWTVRGIIDTIIKADMNDLQKIKAVHDWLVKNTTYTYGYYDRSDSFNHLYNLLNNKIGVCQGYSVSFYIFMGELGIPCVLITGNADNGNGVVGHAWNAVKINNEWYFVDVTWDDPIINGTSNYADGDNLSYEYLLCPYSVISKTHTNNTAIVTEPVPVGTSTAYNDQMYRLSGFTDVYRITSYDSIPTKFASAVNSGIYAVILENDSLDVETVYNKIYEYLCTLGKGFYISVQSGNSVLKIKLQYE